MPSLRSIEVFGAYAKNFVGMNFDKDRNLNGVNDQMGWGWCGNEDWPVREGGGRNRTVRFVRATPPGNECLDSGGRCIESYHSIPRHPGCLSYSGAVIPGYDEMEDGVNTDVIMDEMLAGEAGHVAGFHEGVDGIWIQLLILKLML